MSPGQYVVFALGNERYGLPIASVERIVNAVPVTRIPLTPPSLLGLFDLRGDTLPVVDTRAVLGLPEGEPKCFVVVTARGERAAITADRVDRIVSFAADAIDRMEGGPGTFVGKEGDRLTMLVHPEDLVPEGTLARAA